MASSDWLAMDQPPPIASITDSTQTSSRLEMLQSIRRASMAGSGQLGGHAALEHSLAHVGIRQLFLGLQPQVVAVVVRHRAPEGEDVAESNPNDPKVTKVKSWIPDIGELRLSQLQSPETLTSYVPTLVARRLANDPTPPTEPEAESLPAAVLFADISGFTALTDSLTRTLVARRAASW